MKLMCLVSGNADSVSFLVGKCVCVCVGDVCVFVT